jgi:ABC-type branched-subunit amino acid transport system substrate-binding protein
VTRSRLSLLAAAVLLCGAPAACAANGPPLVVGLLLPPDEPDAIGLRQGALAAAEEANEGPGPRVRLAVRGKTGAWGTDASEAALLVMDDGAGALIAPPSGAASHLVLQVSGKTAVPVASLCPDASVTRASIPWMVRVAPSTLDEARALFEGMAASRWLVFVPAGRAGREASRDLSAAAAASTAVGAGKRSIVRSVETDGRLTDAALRDLLSTVHPDAVLFWVDPVPASRLTRSLRAAGFTGALAGAMRLASPAFAAEAGPSAEGLFVPVFAPEGDGMGAAFESRYRRLFGEAPGPAAAVAYDAAKLLFDMLKKEGAEGARHAFPPAGRLRGATGLLAFDGKGNRRVTLQVRRYRDGRLVRG